MNLTSTTYAAAGIVSLTAGILWSRWGSMYGFAGTLQHVAFSFSGQAFCNLIGAVFAVCALILSIGSIPVSTLATKWHFLLSAGSIVLLLAGGSVLVAIVKSSPGHPALGTTGMVAAIAFLLSIPIFLGAQVWFTVEFVRALARMRSW